MSSRRHLVLIVPWLEVGGADRFNIDLLQQLSKRGWSFTILTTLLSDHPWREKFRALTSDIVILDEVCSPADAPELIENVLRTRDPSAVLLSHSEAAYLLLPAMRASAPEVPFVDLCHSVALDWMNGGYPRYSVDHASGLDLTVVTSEAVKRWMVDQGGNPASIEVVYTSIDLEFWHPDRARRDEVRAAIGIGDHDVLILYAGRLSAEKRPLLAAECLAEAAERDARVRGVVVGDGPLRDDLTRYVSSNGLADVVRLQPAATTEQMRDLMAAADIFFLPSAYEGVALTVYEAMASGVCVVASDVGGQAELVTEGTGILVPTGPGEADRFVAALLGLVDDSRVRATMGSRARQRVTDSFCIDEMGERMDRLLRIPAPRRRSSKSRNITRSRTQTVWYLHLAWSQRMEPTGLVSTVARFGRPLYRRVVARGGAPAKVMGALRRWMWRQAR